MKKKILILASDPFSINYEIIKKSQNFLKRKLKNKYLVIGDQEEISTYIEKNNIPDDISTCGSHGAKKWSEKRKIMISNYTQMRCLRVAVGVCRANCFKSFVSRI